MIILKSGINESNLTEYYLVGLENYQDFEVVNHHLMSLNGKMLDSLDGIYSRVATWESESTTFKVIYHEDVGVYAFVLAPQSENSNQWLERILEKVVENINAEEVA